MQPRSTSLTPPKAKKIGETSNRSWRWAETHLRFAGVRGWEEAGQRNENNGKWAAKSQEEITRCVWKKHRVSSKAAFESHARGWLYIGVTTVTRIRHKCTWLQIGGQLWANVRLKYLLGSSLGSPFAGLSPGSGAAHSLSLVPFSLPGRVTSSEGMSVSYMRRCLFNYLQSQL